MTARTMAAGLAAFLLVLVSLVTCHQRRQSGLGAQTGIDAASSLPDVPPAGPTDNTSSTRRPTGDATSTPRPTLVQGNDSLCIFHVHVRDDAGQPLHSAAVSVLDENESAITKSITAHDGRVALRVSSSRLTLNLVVELGGYAKEWLYIQCPNDSVVPVVLSQSATISGHVLSGDLPVFEADVYAWPETYCQEDLRLSGRVLRTQTGIAGEFSIAGTRPGISYTVRAGSLGRLSEPASGIEAMSEGINLRLAKVFAAIVSFRERSGSTHQPVSIAFRANYSTLGNVIEVSPAALSLAGVPPEGLPVMGGYDFLAACIGIDEASLVGPLHVVLEADGYRPAEADISLHAVDSSGLARYPVLLDPLDDFGHVLVRISDLPTDLTDIRMVWPLMVLHLTSEGRSPLLIPLMTMQSPQEFEIPVGSYEVQLVSTYQDYARRVADDMIVRAGDGIAEVSLHLQELGAVCLEVETPWGTPYTGMLTVDLNREDLHGGSYGTVNFARAPYCLLLTEGIYALQVGLPTMLVPREEYRIDGFGVTPGATLVLALSSAK